MDVLQTLTTITDTLKTLKNHAGTLQARASGLDKELSDCYHMLEGLRLNGAEMVAIASKMRDILRERREIKEQLIMIDNIMNAPCMGKLPNDEVKKSEARRTTYLEQSKAAYLKMFGRHKM